MASAPSSSVNGKPDAHAIPPYRDLVHSIDGQHHGVSHVTVVAAADLKTTPSTTLSQRVDETLKECAKPMRRLGTVEQGKRQPITNNPKHVRGSSGVRLPGSTPDPVGGASAAPVFADSADSLPLRLASHYVVADARIHNWFNFKESGRNMQFHWPPLSRMIHGLCGYGGRGCCDRRTLPPEPDHVTQIRVVQLHSPEMRDNKNHGPVADYVCVGWLCAKTAEFRCQPPLSPAAE
ncbi:hypothetical protein FALBO_12091 [Fusarium albosuccineum]|uniref:Uncharacterized protein n=1 Tax=Fusarium albosuccineum TaxID=1237068 RepID=A0A8H4P3F8_9HYPO|nr:hypothetical protein FALBO_12091 [Fusarium albosuccineum]